MSQKDVFSFFHNAIVNPGMIQTLHEAEHTSSAWLKVAQHGGYRFTEDELRSMGEEILHKSLPKDDFVDELAKNLFADGSHKAKKAPKTVHFSPEALERIKGILEQGKLSGYYRPW